MTKADRVILAARAALELRERIESLRDAIEGQSDELLGKRAFERSPWFEEGGEHLFLAYSALQVLAAVIGDSASKLERVASQP